MKKKPVPEEITRLLENPDEGALQHVLALTYDELKSLARSFFSGQGPSHTLQPTALVHEVFLKLKNNPDYHFKSRGHFFAFIAIMMRRVLTDYSRKKQSEKRGGLIQKVPLEDEQHGLPLEMDFLQLNQALKDLEKKDPRKAQVVELKFFGGANTSEIAEYLDISTATVERDWTMAKAWLFGQLK